MSDWRAELCRRSYAAFRKLDLDALLPLYEPDCEWHVGDARAVVGTPSYRGHRGLRAYVRDIGSVYPDFSPEIDEIRTRGDGALVLRFRVSATARDVGLRLDEQLGGQVIEFSERRIRRVTQTPFPPPGWDEATPVE